MRGEHYVYEVVMRTLAATGLAGDVDVLRAGVKRDEQEKRDTIVIEREGDETTNATFAGDRVMRENYTVRFQSETRERLVELVEQFSLLTIASERVRVMIYGGYEETDAGDLTYVDILTRVIL